MQAHRSSRQEGMGCFRSSEGFSQAVPESRRTPRLILLLFGGIPNSPSVRKMSSKWMLAERCQG